MVSAPSPKPTGRPSKCGRCGSCERCKRAAYQREWWASLTPEQKREKIAARDPERVKATERARYQRNREARAERTARWKRENRARLAELARQYRQANPEKKRAHKAVRRALAKGVLVRQPCETCGTTDRVHAHHDDYAKPLDVRWLCPRHHAAVHHANPSS